MPAQIREQTKNTGRARRKPQRLLSHTHHPNLEQTPTGTQMNALVVVFVGYHTETFDISRYRTIEISTTYQACFCPPPPPASPSSSMQILNEIFNHWRIEIEPICSLVYRYHIQLDCKSDIQLGIVPIIVPCTLSSDIKLGIVSNSAFI